jgi:hypothetical protein
LSKSQVIAAICKFVANGDRQEGSALARDKYPFTRAENPGRRYSEYQMTQVFFRDGFVDRYTGEQLVFPGTLRLLSTLMPEEFPVHPNWKMSESHIAYWELFPTIDHVVPVARGGSDDESNWVTTSMLRNSAKANWTVEELGWALHPEGSTHGWDGLMAWFVEYAARNSADVATGYLERWRAAAVKVLAEHATVVVG